MIRHRRLRWPLLLVALAGSSLAAGCGGGDDDSGGGDGGGAPAGGAAEADRAQPAASGPKVVQIEEFKFMPAEIEVDAGSTIRWTNQDSASHTASANGSGGFDTGTIKEGETKTAKVEKAGTIAYICDFHPFMKATVTVR